MIEKRFRKGKSILTDFPTGAIIDEKTGERYYDGIKPSYISSNELVKILNKLNDENEQLKSTIKEVIEILVEEVDLFSDKATEHDVNAYLELLELDNKDAFYMATATKTAIKMLKELI